MGVEEMNKMQLVKREFFALRNGELARQMRELGAPYRIIFGLNLPQIVGTATKFGPDKELALKLWANTTTRESLLIAPMLVPADDFTEQEAEAWLREAPTPEVADVVCHRLLRKLPFAPAMAVRLAADPEPMVRYGALRLIANLLQIGKFDSPEAECVARRELKAAVPLTASLCRLILDATADF